MVLGASCHCCKFPSGCLQDDGYRDPNTGEIRHVPFEIMVEGDKQPIYEETLEDVRRFNENPQLPFNAFGTLALARQEFDANSGSSQVFFLLKVCCAVLCDVLCCAAPPQVGWIVLGCAGLGSAGLSCTMMCCAVPCCALLWHFEICCAVLGYPAP